MALVSIGNSRAKEQNHWALFNLAFRPFFIGASVFASISILAWLLVYGGRVNIQTAPYSLFEWHAHEMIYGFTVAVIAGFLLTAIMNWTGVQTLNGTKLQLLFIAWLVPRFLFLFGTRYILLAAVFEGLFNVGLLYAVIAPIVQVKQWKQLGVVTMVCMLALGNTCFYFQALNLFPRGAFFGLYGGLFVIVSLILTIGGRVMPAFVRNGVDEPVDIENPFWLAVLSFVLFVSFIASYLFGGCFHLSGGLAIALFFATTYRLVCWHTPGIWSKPLLWGLFCAYISIDLGFLLFALHYFLGISPFPAVHAFAYGGIGLSTLAMMSRVSLGHTGRSIRKPPRVVALLLSLLAIGTLVRVLPPVVESSFYPLWIMLSQVSWILAFAGFALSFSKMLLTARVDGKAG